jgi:glyoxylase-like metal-dependent hydrolase (beta-lactamase superfamily II)
MENNMTIHKFVFSPIGVNTYILEDKSGECAVIDCGCYDEDEFLQLQHYIEEKNLKPVLLLNTHCHLDHIFGNRFMLEKYNLRSRYHELEEMNRKLAVSHAEVFSLTMEFPPDPGDYLRDNDIVKFGSVVLKTLLVPGHTPGGIAFWCEAEGCVFTGDSLFEGSIGRSDLPGGDHDALLKSIRTRLFTLPSYTVVYPGHGDKTDISTEMRYNPYFS